MRQGFSDLVSVAIIVMILMITAVTVVTISGGVGKTAGGWMEDLIKGVSGPGSGTDGGSGTGGAAVGSCSIPQDPRFAIRYQGEQYLYDGKSDSDAKDWKKAGSGQSQALTVQKGDEVSIEVRDSVDPSCITINGEIGPYREQKTVTHTFSRTGDTAVSYILNTPDVSNTELATVQVEPSGGGGASGVHVGLVCSRRIPDPASDEMKISVTVQNPAESNRLISVALRPGRGGPVFLSDWVEVKGGTAQLFSFDTRPTSSASPFQDGYGVQIVTHSGDTPPPKPYQLSADTVQLLSDFTVRQENIPQSGSGQLCAGPQTSSSTGDVTTRYGSISGVSGVTLGDGKIELHSRQASQNAQLLWPLPDGDKTVKVSFEVKNYGHLRFEACRKESRCGPGDVPTHVNLDGNGNQHIWYNDGQKYRDTGADYSAKTPYTLRLQQSGSTVRWSLKNDDSGSTVWSDTATVDSFGRFALDSWISQDTIVIKVTKVAVQQGSGD